MNFAANLKRICNERGTTPTALLKTLGIATSKVSMWNKGSLPKPEIMTRLADALKCNVSDFFTSESEVTLEKNVEKFDEDEMDVIRVFRKLPRRYRHEFMSMVYEYEKKCNE